MLPASRPAATGKKRKTRVVRKAPSAAPAPRVSTKTVPCPACGAPMKVKVIRGLSARARDSDFRPHLQPGFGQANYLWTCSRCCYSSLPRQFRKRKGLAGIRRALARLTGGKREFAKGKAARAYHCAIAVNRAAGAGLPRTSELLLRAVWAAREARDPGAERWFRKQAVATLRRALLRKKMRPSQVPTVYYLLGELYRRHGDFRSAAHFLGRAAASLRGRKGARGLMALTKRSWALVKKKRTGGFVIGEGRKGRARGASRRLRRR